MGHAITATIEFRVPATADKYGDVLKIVQIGFYTRAPSKSMFTNAAFGQIQNCS